MALKPALAPAYLSLLEEGTSPGEESIGAHGVRLQGPLDSTLSLLTLERSSLPGLLGSALDCLSLIRIPSLGLILSSREPRQPLTVKGDGWAPCKEEKSLGGSFPDLPTQ